MSDVLLTSAAAIVTFMLAFWLASIPLRNVSIVDIGWGLGFVLVAWASWLSAGGQRDSADEFLNAGLLLPVLVTIWGCRLSAYLAWRNHGKPEDYRYAAMRQNRGRSFVWSSLLIVFALQGAIMLIVALPVMAAAARPASSPCWYLTAVGVASWLIGLTFEAVGDWQLARFKSDYRNAGRVMDRGLWRYTRHPNYFGDCCIWWGHWLVSLGLSDYRVTWWTIISPLLMTLLLLKVSGVALLERAMKQRSPEYEAYIARTSTFFPRPPRR
ncbi:MAG: DUF1295 domain-containing protein [Planctomycetota bacterium]|jgi:steroid 5-alpha reductase family enzyme